MYGVAAAHEISFFSSFKGAAPTHPYVYEYAPKENPFFLKGKGAALARYIIGAADSIVNFSFVSSFRTP